MDLSKDAIGHVAATAFGGRITAFAKDPLKRNREYVPRYPPVNLVIPNASCSLPFTGGRAVSRVTGPVNLEVDGVRIVSLKSAETEVFDQRATDQVSAHARVRMEKFEIGVDEQLSIRESDFELVSDVTVAQDQRVYAFHFRKHAYDRIEFAGKPLKVKFREDLIQRKSAFAESAKVLGQPTEASEESFRRAIGTLKEDNQKLLMKARIEVFADKFTAARLGEIAAAGEDALTTWKHFRPGREVHKVAVNTVTSTVVDWVEYDGVRYGHVVPLPNLGIAYFGEVIVTDTSWRFSFVRLALGSPAQGQASAIDIISNGQ